MDSSKLKKEPKQEEDVSLATIHFQEEVFQIKEEDIKLKEEEPAIDVQQLAPVIEEDEPEEEEPAAPGPLHVAALVQGPPQNPDPDSEEEGEPAPPGEADSGDFDGDPYGLGPRGSRSPPATRAVLRSLSATASKKPRKKTSFYPSR